MSARRQQGAANRPLLLDLQQIMKLTDAAQTLFGFLYDWERAIKRDAKHRAAVLARELDPFGPGLHYRDDEEYRPGGETPGE